MESILIASAFAIVGILLHVRRLPAQNLCAIAFLVLALSASVEAASRYLSIPYRTVASVSVWALPFVWLGILLVSRRIAQWVYSSRAKAENYGLLVLLGTVVSSGLMWTIVLFIASELSLWAIISRTIVALLILLAVFPFFIVKHPGAKGYRG